MKEYEATVRLLPLLPSVKCPPFLQCLPLAIEAGRHTRPRKAQIVVPRERRSFVPPLCPS
jgi:hypothetical protein